MTDRKKQTNRSIAYTPSPREGGRMSILVLVPTGETHSNGWQVYRPKGTPLSSNSKGLSGQYYTYDGEEMYKCGAPYKDEYGCFDGEAICSITNYIITRNADEVN